MKFFEVFKKWWFWLIVIGYSIISIFSNLAEYGSLFFVEYIGIFLGAFMGTFFFYALIFGLTKLFRKILPKDK